MMPLVEIVFATSMSMMVGIYFIFSNTIMITLQRIEDDLGSSAHVMVEINRVILNPVFMTCFIVSGMGAVYFIFYGDVLEIVAGVFFFIGTTMVTIIKNVPLNERLKNTIGDAALTQLWRHYLRVWTRWNHVRTISSIIAVVLMFVD